MIPQVSNFLFCLSLEAGGYICGIFTGVISLITLISFISIFFTALSADASAGWWTIMVLTIIYVALFLYASIMLVLGTKNSQPGKMRLYLIFLIVSVIFAFLQIIVSLLGGLIFAILWAIIVTYIFICIYSLFKSKGGSNIFW